MKPCIFCGKTAANHKCPVKAKAVVTGQKTREDSQIDYSQVENRLLPRVSQVLTLSHDCQLLKQVLQLLSCIAPFSSEIKDHTCYSACSLCYLKNGINADRIDDGLVNRLYNKICELAENEIEMIDFSNCLQIVLNFIHFSYIGKCNHTPCRYKCLAHKVFGIDGMEILRCFCTARKEIPWKQTEFFHCAILNDTVQRIEDALFENNGKRLEVCIENLNCRYKSTSRQTRYHLFHACLVVKVVYDTHKIAFGIDSYYNLRVPEYNESFVLRCFVCETTSIAHIFEYSKDVWTCKTLENLRIPRNSLQALLSQYNLKPTLLFYLVLT
jgi:hypothetical protein